MSNLTDFFPSGGGGIKINQLTQFGNAPDLYIDNDGEEYLAAGIISTATNLYPDANAKGGNLSLTTLSNTYATTSQTIYPECIYFKTDGLSMYVGDLGSSNVIQYTLSTAWDISTAVFLQSVSTNAGQCFGLSFGLNGTKMYVIGPSSFGVSEYTLSTAWDISTRSYVQNFIVSTQDTSMTGVQISPDGTKMYLTGANSDQVFQYNISTPFDLSTATYNQFFEPYFNNPEDLYFATTGYTMYLVNSSQVQKYALSTAWDISTASKSGSVFATGTDSRGLFFREDLLKMYVSGRTSSGKISEWDISAFIGLESANNLDANTYIRIK